MEYLRQIHMNPANEMALDWAHIKAKSPQDAALSGLDIDKLSGSKKAYIYVACNTPDNRHRNGMPIAVHRFDVEIGRNIY